MRIASIVAGLALIATACTDRTSPVAATAIAGPTPILSTPALPTAIAGVLSLGLPVEPGDAASAQFGVMPYGLHAPDHAQDGHAGWDIEYRTGGIVRAAATGMVESITPDPSLPGRVIVAIAHLVGDHHYRTVYTNLASLAADIAQNETVRAGQALGTPGVSSAGAATIHFQLDDFEYYRDTSNPNAVSPEPFLTAPAKSLFESLWSRANYAAEVVEPFPTNPRTLAFPASRTWMRAGGDGPGGLRFTRRRADALEYEYALLAESGTAVETGVVVLNASARPYATIDLVSPTSRRLAVYDITSNEMRLALAAAGSSRPTDLAAASTYRTSR